MTLTFENEQDFDLGFDPEEVAAAVINGVLDQEACPVRRHPAFQNCRLRSDWGM